MSIRAVKAYEDSEMPKSKWTKKAMLAVIKDYCEQYDFSYDNNIETLHKKDLFDRFFEWKSWHHTGKFANETDFYGVDEEAIEEHFKPLTDKEIEQRWRERQLQYSYEQYCMQVKQEEMNNVKEWEEEYEAEHGFKPNSFAAFQFHHPDCIEHFVSKAGNDCIRVYPNGRAEGKFFTGDVRSLAGWQWDNPNRPKSVNLSPMTFDEYCGAKSMDFKESSYSLAERSMEVQDVKHELNGIAEEQNHHIEQR